jgi:hypothetical protein
MNKRCVFVCLVFSALAVEIHAQEKNITRATMHQGDTIPMVVLSPHGVYARRSFKNKREEQRFNRLQKKVMKVYPYAKLAGQQLELYAKELENVDKERQKRMYYKKIEEELKAQYMEELKNLTITEGAILIKLIDRETQNTSYQLVRDFRGQVSAFFWQGLARIFGQNLKNEYDPNGDDRDIEFIVKQIESGQLP